MRLKKETIVLLRMLRENSRQSLSKMSREAQVSLPRLVRGLAVLEREVIRRYVSVLDFGRLDCNLRVIFFVEAKNGKALEDFILGQRSLNSCSRLEKGRFWLEGVFGNMRELADFRERFSALDANILQEHFVTEVLKVEGFVAEF